MTKYETIAVILSTVAILIPIIRWAVRKWLIKAELFFYPTGHTYLYFDQIGSYLRIDGVYEARNKPVVIRNMTVQVIRKKDNATRIRQWNSFVNPANQTVMGAVTSMTEAAHPFRIEADSVMCAFTVFTDFYASSQKSLQQFFEASSEVAMKLESNQMPFAMARNQFVNSPEYIKLQEQLKKECFWEISKYDVIIITEYENRKKEFKYKFEITKDTMDIISCNIEETAFAKLNELYRIPNNYKLASVDIEVQ